VKKPRKLYEGVYSTGELDGIEQSLSQFGKVCCIIGGLHGTEPESLKDLDLICPAYCTQYKSEVKSLYPEKYIEGGAGKIIEVN